MDWNTLLSEVITQILVIVLPTVITYAITKALGAWSAFKKANEGDVAVQMVERLAYIAVNAAQQVGGDNESKKQYAYGVVADAVDRLPIKFTPEQLYSVIDSSIEAAVKAMKAEDSASQLCEPQEGMTDITISTY